MYTYTTGFKDSAWLANLCTHYTVWLAVARTGATLLFTSTGTIFKNLSKLPIIDRRLAIYVVAYARYTALAISNSM